MKYSHFNSAHDKTHGRSAGYFNIPCCKVFHAQICLAKSLLQISKLSSERVTETWRKREIKRERERERDRAKTQSRILLTDRTPLLSAICHVAWHWVPSLNMLLHNVVLFCHASLLFLVMYWWTKVCSDPYGFQYNEFDFNRRTKLFEDTLIVSATTGRHQIRIKFGFCQCTLSIGC